MPRRVSNNIEHRKTHMALGEHKPDKLSLEVLDSGEFHVDTVSERLALFHGIVTDKELLASGRVDALQLGRLHLILGHLSLGGVRLFGGTVLAEHLRDSHTNAADQVVIGKLVILGILKESL